MKALKVMKLWRPSCYARSKWLHYGKWEKDGGKKRRGVRKEDKWCSSRITEDWLWWSCCVLLSHAPALSYFYLSFRLLLLIPLTGCMGPLLATRATFDLRSPLLVFKKKKKKVTVACGIMFIDKLRDKCARVTPTAKCSSQQKKISHGQNIKDTCAGVHCADMLYMSLILQAIPSSVSAELWRLQWLPITWQR